MKGCMQKLCFEIDVAISHEPSIYIKLPRLCLCVCLPDFSCRPISMELFMVHGS